jgi:hypothetical protein
MPLMQLARSEPETIASLTIEQVVSVAGNGQLLDNSECSIELREYLQQAAVEKLGEYAEHCLRNPFTNSGRVLQDTVNELGRRLEYQVTNGRYQGVQGGIGYDGLWRSPEGHCIVVEVKTTDVYRISLDTIIKYRRALQAQGVIEEGASVLIVVGRQDTGELEAQVRGSRHAWEVRLLSVDALLKLANLKQDTDDPETSEKIRALLVPREYTRLDGIIEVMFSTARDVVVASVEVSAPPDHAENSDSTEAAAIDVEAISAQKARIVATVAKRLGTSLAERTRATFWDGARTTRIVCSVSRNHMRGNYRYWYAYHPKWDEFLEEGRECHVVWGCLDANVAFMIPHKIMREQLHALSVTRRPSGVVYWHVKILRDADGRYALQRSTDGNLDLSPFQITLTD